VRCANHNLKVCRQLPGLQGKCDSLGRVVERQHRSNVKKTRKRSKEVKYQVFLLSCLFFATRYCEWQLSVDNREGRTERKGWLKGFDLL
jgi:hypothetical protein